MALPDEGEVRKAAILDGMQCIPAWDAVEFAPYIRVLIQRTKSEDNDIMKRYHAESINLEMALQNAKHGLDKAKKAWKNADGNLHQTRNAYSNVHSGDFPHIRPMRGFWYAFWLLLLFIFELPLNSVVFRIFGESEAMTLLFTVGISVLLLLCAHELGRMLRTEQQREPARQYFIPALLIFPLLIIGGVAYAREMYIELLPLANSIRNPVLLYLSFAAINITVIVAATTLSYGYHIPGLAQVEHDQQEMHKAEQRLALAESKFAEVCKLEMNKRRDTRHDIERNHNAAEHLYVIYKTENLRVRPDRNEAHATAQPRSFERPLPLKMPAELLASEWETSEETDNADEDDGEQAA